MNSHMGNDIQIVGSWYSIDILFQELATHFILYRTIRVGFLGACISFLTIYVLILWTRHSASAKHSFFLIANIFIPI